MKIASANVSLASNHTLLQEQSREESLRFWTGEERPVFAGEAPHLVRISPEARRLQSLGNFQTPALQQNGSSQASVCCGRPSSGDPRLDAMRLILEALTGKKINVADFKPRTSPEPVFAGPADNSGGTPPTGTADSGTPPRRGWGLEYDLHESLREEETLAFSAKGKVLTADGQSMDFTLDMLMRREFVATSSLQIRAGDARLVDPLVVNFNGRGAELAGSRFAFDLNGDGTDEEIASLVQGSGFLAFDRNNDGEVNNGSELFGPASGHGFAELAEFDSDSNGWLDENDPMYAELTVWMRDEAGGSSLASLKEKNIGAILLNPASTEFSLKNGENQLLGQIRESSVFLQEDGGVGTVQEIDIAV